MSALLLSPIVRAIAGAAVLAGSFLVWLAIHDAKVERAATAEVVSVIKEKADANAQTADAVRDAVASDKRGVRNPNPYRRPGG